LIKDPLNPPKDRGTLRQSLIKKAEHCLSFLVKLRGKATFQGVGGHTLAKAKSSLENYCFINWNLKLET